MNLPKLIRHNPSTFTALLIGLLIVAGFLGCQLARPDLLKVQAVAAEIAATAAPLAPPPYREILIGISTLLSSGILVDNRRKDSIIKILKASNANKKK